MIGQMKASAEKPTKVRKRNRTQEKKPGRGAAKLREAVDDVLTRDSKKLAEALSKTGQNGRVQSTKFMYGLSEAGEAADGEEDAERIRRMALELENSPEWAGSSTSEMGDEMDEGVTD